MLLYFVIFSHFQRCALHHLGALNNHNLGARVQYSFLCVKRKLSESIYMRVCTWENTSTRWPCSFSFLSIFCSSVSFPEALVRPAPSYAPLGVLGASCNTRLPMIPMCTIKKPCQTLHTTINYYLKHINYIILNILTAFESNFLTAGGSISHYKLVHTNYKFFCCCQQQYVFLRQKRRGRGRGGCSTFLGPS